MTLARYLLRLLLARLVVSLFAVAALLQLFDLFNNARTLLSRGGTTADLVTYAGLRFPIIVEQALPIAMLVGTLATLLSLARSSEMTAMKSAGVTIYRVLATCAPAAVIAGIIHFTLIDVVTPWSERRFLDWWSGFKPDEQAENDDAVWLRGADTVTLVRGIAEDGQALTGIKIVRLAPNGIITGWLEAEAGRRTSNGWILETTRTARIENGRVTLTKEENRAWPGILDPATIVKAASPQENLSTAQLRMILRGTYAGENSPAYYRTRLYRSYASPLASLLMLLLAAPAAYTIRRRGETGGGLALGFGLGMAYLLTDGLLAALGGAGVLPPLLAAWIPPALFALVASSVVLYYEE